jgi:hypothetical protein
MIQPDVDLVEAVALAQLPGRKGIEFHAPAHEIRAVFEILHFEIQQA